MQAQMQAQMQAEFELRDAKLKAKQRRQEILARSCFREGSQISYKSRLFSKKSYSGTGPHVATIFKRSKKGDNQVVAPRTGETDAGLGLLVKHPIRLSPCVGLPVREPRCLNLGALMSFSMIFLTQLLNQKIVYCLLLRLTLLRKSTLLFFDEMVCMLVEPVNVRGRPERRCHQDSSVASFRIQGRVKYYHNVALIVMYLNVCGM